MTAEVYGFDSTPISGDQDEQRQPTKRALELVPDEIMAEVLQLAESTWKQFKAAFAWEDAMTDELFERIVGSEDEPSDELRTNMFELYLTSRASAFVQDESRVNYKFIFESFTGSGHSVETVRRLLEEQQIVPYEIDKVYVMKHLLMTISKMSMHHE